MPELDEKKRIIAYDTVNDPDENYYALIDNGTAGTGKVSIKGLGPADMISDQYSDSSTYKVGDLCIHNNKLYVCTVAINTPHAFNLSEWELDTLGNYASQIKQSLSDLTDLTEEYLDFTYNQKTIRIYFRFRKNFVTVIAIKSDTTMEFPTAWTDIGTLSKAPSSTMYIPLNLLNGNTITLRWYPTTGKVDCMSNVSTAAWVQTTTTIMYS